MSTTVKVTGKAYKILADASQKIWNKVSFWTAAKDVELDSTDTVEDVIGTGLVSDLATISSITEAGSVPDALALKEINNNLGGLKFRKQDGLVQWSEDGINWGNFSNGSLGEIVQATLTDQNGTTEIISMQIVYISKEIMRLAATKTWTAYGYRASNQNGQASVSFWSWDWSVNINGKEYTNNSPGCSKGFPANMSFIHNNAFKVMPDFPINFSDYGAVPGGGYGYGFYFPRNNWLCPYGDYDSRGGILACIEIKL